MVARRRVRVFGSFRGLSAKATEGLDVVIVDVLRATSTIVFAVSRGARVLTLADEHAALERGKALGDQAILVGEHMGKRLDGFHCNNSPCELGAFDLAGKTVVLTTTNGTKAIAACANAHRVFAGALTNAPALGRHLCLHGTLERDVAIVCAGRSTGALALEDLLGAGAVVAAIVAASTGGELWLADGARVASDLFARAREDLVAAVRASDAAQDLVEAGGGADVDACGTHGAHEIVACLRDGIFVGS